jgi:flagellar hook-basal body complex protein FliE
MSEIDMNSVLLQMRAMAARAHGAEAGTAINRSGGSEFSNLFKGAVDKVNQTQQSAEKLATAFEKGDPGTDVAQVMLAMQKANLSFQAITQVRNKLVNAYQEIMNMQV